MLKWESWICEGTAELLCPDVSCSLREGVNKRNANKKQDKAVERKRNEVTVS